MNDYFRILWIALCGNNPYLIEMDKVKEEMKKAGENVRMLREEYYKEVEKAAEAEKLHGEAVKMLEKADMLMTDKQRQLNSLQKLVENQRERLAEKDAMIEDLHQDYKRQMANYEKRVKDHLLTIDRLRRQVMDLKKDQFRNDVE